MFELIKQLSFLICFGTHLCQKDSQLGFETEKEAPDSLPHTLVATNSKLLVFSNNQKLLWKMIHHGRKSFGLISSCEHNDGRQ